MNNKLFNKDWKADVKASSFTSTKKLTKEKRLYERIENGYKLTVSGTNPDGTVYEWGYTALKDGEKFPVYGREDVDSIIAHKVTEEITIGDFYKDGNLVGAYQRNMSKDGKSLTVIFAGVDKDTKPYFDVIKYVTE